MENKTNLFKYQSISKKTVDCLENLRLLKSCLDPYDFEEILLIEYIEEMSEKLAIKSNLLLSPLRGRGWLAIEKFQEQRKNGQSNFS